jgi:hypothetical protein
MLDDRQLDLLADRLADRLAARLALPPSPSGQEALVDATELARLLGKSRSWVYEHAGELGAVRLGSGPRARLGFFPGQALQGLERVAEPRAQEMPPRAEPPRRPRRKDGLTPSGAPLLKVRGQAPRSS